MKKHLGIKLQLLGIGLIALIPYTTAFQDGYDVLSSVISGIGAFTPIIGLILCIAGLFYKEK